MGNYELTPVASVLARLAQRTNGENVFWTQEEGLGAISEALRVWQALTGQYGLTHTTGNTGSSPFLSVPRQMASVQRITSNDSPLTLISLYELDTGWPGWETSGVGAPRFWAPCGINEVAIYPWSTQVNLTFYGYSDLGRVGAADWLNIGNEELTYLLDYAAHYLSFKEGFSETQATTEAVKRMLQAAALKNARIAETNTYKRFLGLDRQEGEKPLADAKTLGVRT